MAEALYRKYRPQVFEDVVGQEPIERTLKNAIAQDKVSHAYLFCGPRGTGKTTTARLLAKALLCQSGPTPEPDGTCDDCKLIAEGLHPDVYELDAASRTGVENVREEIISRVQFAPTRGRSKVYIIDEVHMLSVAAFNALLKTLEEPPSHVVFVLCTTDPQKVPETIHSRCQRFDFRRITHESMVSRLGAICIAEGVEFEGEALDLIAQRAEGGLRNALTSLEQIIAFENGKVTLDGAERLLGSIDSNDMAEIVGFVGQRDIAGCFRWTAAYVETGADLAQFVRDMAEHVRNLYVLALVGDDVELDINETTRHQMITELEWFGPDRLSRLMGVLGDLIRELKTSSNPRLAFEIALTRMVRPDSDLTLEALAERVEALENGYSAVAHVLPGAPMQRRGSEEDPLGAGYVDSTPSDVARYQLEPQPSQAMSMRQPAYQEQAQEPKVAASADFVQSQQVRHGQAQAQGREASADPSLTGAIRVDADAQASVARDGRHQAMPEGEKFAVLENPATVQRVWQATLSAVKKQKQAYGVLFMNAKARFDADASALRISFPAEAAFAYNAVQKPEVQEALAAALERAFGTAVPFMYERAGQGGTAVTRTVSEKRSQAQVKAQVQSQVQPQPQAQPQSQSQVQPQSQAQPEPQFQPRPQAQPEPQFQPQHQAQQQAQPWAQVQPEPQGRVRAQRQSQAQDDARGRSQVQDDARGRSQVQDQPRYAPSYDDLPPYDDVVPYEDIPYEVVPYEELDMAPARPARRIERQPASSREFSAASGGASPSTPSEGRLAQGADEPENQPDVEALLQAGFGGGVIFSEVED